MFIPDICPSLLIQLKLFL